MEFIYNINNKSLNLTDINNNNDQNNNQNIIGSK